MPANIVKTKADEKHWNEAKARVKEQYPDIDEDNDRHWKLVTAVFQKMSGLRKNLFEDIHPDVATALTDYSCQQCADLPLTARAAHLRRVTRRYRNAEAKAHQAQVLAKAVIMVSGHDTAPRFVFFPPQGDPHAAS
jgi:hypothetical protein